VRTLIRRPPTDTEELRAQFETCVGRVESRGLIRRLSFGNLVLLQPELLGAYASAIMQLLEQQIPQIKSVAVIVGKGAIGPWQQPDAPRKPELPIFLRGMTWVDFRKDGPDPMEQLIWGITGVRITG
jgi:hypothetical protein